MNTRQGAESKVGIELSCTIGRELAFVTLETEISFLGTFAFFKLADKLPSGRNDLGPVM
jgi:hypothetical protein